MPGYNIKIVTLFVALFTCLSINNTVHAETFPIEKYCSVTLKVTPMTKESLKPYMKKGRKLLISRMAEDSVLGLVYGVSIVTPKGDLLLADTLMKDWVSVDCTKEQLSKEKAKGYFLKAATLKGGPFGFRPLCEVPAKTSAKAVMLDDSTFQFLENIEGCEADLTKEPVKVDKALLITYPR